MHADAVLVPRRDIKSTRGVRVQEAVRRSALRKDRIERRSGGGAGASG
jgi:hypothetical protein